LLSNATAVDWPRSAMAIPSSAAVTLAVLGNDSMTPGSDNAAAYRSVKPSHAGSPEFKTMVDKYQRVTSAEPIADRFQYTDRDPQTKTAGTLPGRFASRIITVLLGNLSAFRQ
jgi:hypothetical protein